MFMAWGRAEITFCVACAPCANRGTCDWRFVSLLEKRTAIWGATRWPSFGTRASCLTQELTRAPAV